MGTYLVSRGGCGCECGCGCTCSDGSCNFVLLACVQHGPRLSRTWPTTTGKELPVHTLSSQMSIWPHSPIRVPAPMRGTCAKVDFPRDVLRQVPFFSSSSPVVLSLLPFFLLSRRWTHIKLHLRAQPVSVPFDTDCCLCLPASTIGDARAATANHHRESTTHPPPHQKVSVRDGDLTCPCLPVAPSHRRTSPYAFSQDSLDSCSFCPRRQTRQQTSCRREQTIPTASATYRNLARDRFIPYCTQRTLLPT